MCYGCNEQVYSVYKFTYCQVNLSQFPDLSTRVDAKKLSIIDCRNFTDLSQLCPLPPNLLELTFDNCRKLFNFSVLKLPINLKKLTILFSPLFRLTDFNNNKLPISLEEIRTNSDICENENDIFQLLITNGYYNDIELTTEKDNNAILQINGVMYEPSRVHIQPTGEDAIVKINYAMYKRRCVNINYLFDNDNSFGWDFNLNKIIDNYIGFKIDYC